MGTDNSIPWLTAPLAVNPNSGMKYFGRVLDLDGFDGSVIIKNSEFTLNILRYATCDVA